MIDETRSALSVETSALAHMSERSLFWDQEPTWKTYRTNVEGETVKRLVGRIRDQEGQTSTIDASDKIEFYQMASEVAQKWGRVITLCS